ncbi:proline dehydrogenase family protein [Microbacterium nymphoidis]|uniref:proline dehydrogenase family protein n=1 Tax=Microbacterium nymphoidis TaxID=2898586 RepID=UPI001E551EC7|nr:proline dehydrogenase family protein [Microbacterium nymphoidis]MCD2497969.1 proline dehydrogenase family protein [Microbacterium nymphoidis]
MAENVVPDSDREHARENRDADDASASAPGEHAVASAREMAVNALVQDPVDEAISMANAWLSAAAATDEPRIADLLADPDGVAFARAFIDGVLRPESLSAAAGNLHRLGADIPAALPWHLRGAVRVGAAVAPVLPTPVVPLSRRLLRERMAPLSIDGRRIEPGVAALHGRYGAERPVELRVPSVALTGAARLTARLEQVIEIVRRHEADAIAVPLALVRGPELPWAFDDQVDATVARLRPLVEAALATGTALTVEVELASELDLAVAVLIQALEDPAYVHAPLGIAFSAALPDALPALQQLAAWARSRSIADLAPLAVRIGTGIDPRERADAAVGGWPLAVYDTSEDARANAIALLDEVLGPDADGAVSIALDTSDPYLLAYARVLAARAERTVALHLHPGVLPALQRAILADVPGVVLSAPVLLPGSGLDAAAMLSALLDEREEDGALSAVLPLIEDNDARAEGARALRAAADRARTHAIVTGPRRVQDRAHPEAAIDTRLLRAPAPADESGLTQEVIGIARASAATDTSPIAPAEGLLFGGAPFVETAVFAARENPGGALGVPGFRNAPASDPSTAANREWARGIIARMVDAGGVGEDADIESGDLDATMSAVAAAAPAWGARPAMERSAVLRRFALLFDAHRGEFIARAGATLFADADADATDVIDAAAHAASLARELDAVSGAVFIPARVTAVSVQAAASTADAAGEVFAALAAGSGVIVIAPRAVREQFVLIQQVLAEAELPDHLLAVTDLTDDEAVAPAGVDLLVRVGAREPLAGTAVTVADREPGVNAVIVAPSADLERAAADVVIGAFSRAGQGLDATAAVILVGPVGRSRRFIDALVDGARTLAVGHPEDPRAVVGPLVSAPEGDELAALTQPADGESWWLEPRRVDDRLWTPGILGGVRAGSLLHTRAVAAPVLAVSAVATLAEAVELQNAMPTARVAGLHTQDPADLAHWLDAARAAALVVNRPTTGARAQRRPVHSWTEVGTIAASGGPHHLVGFGTWRASGGGASSSTLHLRGLDARVVAIIEAAQPDLDYASFDAVRRGALSDAVAWDREFARVKDASGLRFERHLLRYRRTEVAVRAAADAAVGDIVRSLVAAVRTGSAVTLSRPVGLPAGVRHALAEQGIPVFVEDDAQWIERVRHTGVRRVRAIGMLDPETLGLLRETTSDAPVTVFADEVTTAGRLELLPYLREQAVSITAHRAGRVDAFSAAVI